MTDTEKIAKLEAALSAALLENARLIRVCELQNEAINQYAKASKRMFEQVIADTPSTFLYLQFMNLVEENEMLRKPTAESFYFRG